jgi:uncharacterized protein (DUF952 family)
VSVSRIYHLVTEADFNASCTEGRYLPRRFEADGFVHCTGDPEGTLAVAGSYFAEATSPVLVLVIAFEKLNAPCRFEAPAPLPGGGAHRVPGRLFPHVYGPIPLAAIEAVGRLERRGEGFVWPATLAGLPLQP